MHCLLFNLLNLFPTAIFLIKEDIEEVDLSAIQVVLWRTGDFFYDASTLNYLVE